MPSGRFEPLTQGTGLRYTCWFAASRFVAQEPRTLENRSALRLLRASDHRVNALRQPAGTACRRTHKNQCTRHPRIHEMEVSIMTRATANMPAPSTLTRSTALGSFSSVSGCSRFTVRFSMARGQSAV